MSDNKYSFSSILGKIRDAGDRNAPNDGAKFIWDRACNTFSRAAHDIGINDEWDITLDKPQWVTDMETALTPPNYIGNPLVEVFDNGSSQIRQAISDFNTKIINPIGDAAGNGFMHDVDLVKQDIVDALGQGELLATRLQGILGDIGGVANGFITSLPNVNNINDQVMDLIIQQIVQAVKTGEAKLNEQNLMIYAGEFKSGFQFNIPAVHIDADFNFQIGPGTTS